MGKSRSALEVVLLCTALALCVGGIGWFAGWWGPEQTKPTRDGQGPASPSGTKSDTPSLALKQIRKQGSRYDCYAMGRIKGDVLLSGSLKAYRMKFGKAREKATWFAPWTVHFTSTIEKNDGEYLEESRAFHEVRFLRTLAPPELTQLDYKLEPWVNKSLVSLAGKLALTPDGTAQAGAFAAMAAVAGQKYDYAKVARLFGMDEKVLGPQTQAIHGAAGIADAFEGQTVLISSKNDRVRWFHSPDASQEVIKTLERAAAPIDYGPLASIELEIGEQRTISDQIINDMFPPEMREELFDGNDVIMQLNLTRKEDASKDGRTHAVLEGDGSLRFKAAGAGTVDAKITRAMALIDTTDPTGRFLHLLELKVPLEASMLTKRKFFYDVHFAGDLEMEMSYRVNPIE